MNDLQAYQVDNLLLLVGSNPLPNYVAARLLAKDPATTQIMLVCSRETCEEMGQHIAQQLRNDGFTKIDYCEVEESNPPHIRNQIASKVQGLQGSIGLHYTGGTKAMSVHAYLALQAHAHQRTQYSYLDARSLELKIESPLNGGHTLVSIPGVRELLQPALTITDLLKLHGLAEKSSSEPVRWLDAARALVEFHTNTAQAKAWRGWCEQSLRNKDLLPTSKLRNILIKDIPSAKVQTAFLDTYPDLKPEDSITRLAEKVGIPINGKSDELAGWFDGKWLEHYVLDTLQPLQAAGIFDELRMSVQPDLGQGGDNFEFDVAGIRGYQLFALSITTATRKGLLKSKLLEVIVRAEQMGGSEAQVALVCCAERSDIVKLEAEIGNLFRQRQLTKIFGKDSLLTLRDEVEAWVHEVGQGRKAR